MNILPGADTHLTHATSFLVLIYAKKAHKSANFLIRVFGLIRAPYPLKVSRRKFMPRGKETNKTAIARDLPFAFRRLQARELYEPTQDAESATRRVCFRVRLSSRIRGSN